MDEIRTFQNTFSRALYYRMRKEVGCPVVTAYKLKPAHWGWYVEMQDGSCSIEQMPTSQCSDAWEARCKCIEKWQGLKKVKN